SYLAAVLPVGQVLALALRGQLLSSLAVVAAVRREAAAAAVRDELTGLVNRRGLALVGPQIVEAARRRGDAAHCLFLDVDGFQRVNRELSVEVGDEVLIGVAEALRSATRATDVVARCGGDEFCVVGPGTGVPPSEIERRVRDRLASQPPVSASGWEPRVSAGAAVLTPWDAGDLDTLLSKAEQEMHLRRSVRRQNGAPAREVSRD
ncbi:MAG: GGDEF domain-containing protein, partial [Actinomycetota bacterium]|nr:GGDEF domain-containing protein [Actinomycetota bacterium]